METRTEDVYSVIRFFTLYSLTASQRIGRCEKGTKGSLNPLTLCKTTAKRGSSLTSCWRITDDTGMAGEPDTPKDVRPVRRGGHRNLTWEQEKALGPYPTIRPSLNGKQYGWLRPVGSPLRMWPAHWAFPIPRSISGVKS
jgi:hypothetical protein